MKRAPRGSPRGAARGAGPGATERAPGMPLVMQELRGLGVAEGVAIGRAVCLETRELDVYRFPLPEDQVEEELARFRRAAEQAIVDVEELRSRVGSDLGAELAAIFEVRAMLLRDRFRSTASSGGSATSASTPSGRCGKQRRAARALRRVQHSSATTPPTYRTSAAISSAHRSVSHHELSEIGGDVVLIADDLTPSDAVRYGHGLIGFVLESGGRIARRSSPTAEHPHGDRPGDHAAGGARGSGDRRRHGGGRGAAPDGGCHRQYERQRDYDQRTLLLLATRSSRRHARRGGVQLMVTSTCSRRSMRRSRCAGHRRYRGRPSTSSAHRAAL